MSEPADDPRVEDAAATFGGGPTRNPAEHSSPSNGDVPAPTRRQTLKPLELLAGAAIATIFVGLVVLMVTRDVTLTAIAAGIVFIIVLVATAMFVLVIKPDEEEIADLAEQDLDGDGRSPH